MADGERERRPAAPAPQARPEGTRPAPAARPRGEPSGLSYAGPPALTLGGGGTGRSLAETPSPSPSGSGQPLPEPTRQRLEYSFGVDLSPVRLHTDAHAAQAATTFSARAFSYGRHIFLGGGERPNDVGLLAHEVAHVVQQGGTPSVQLSGPGPSDAYEREAQRAATSALHGEPAPVRERLTQPRVQRLGISDALDYFADKANNIPGYRMFTIIIGVNPINMSRVERSAANILRAIVEFLPGGGLITQALDNYGIFERVGSWIEGQISTLGITAGSIRRAIMDFLDSLSWRDIFRLGSVWDRAKRIFTDPIDRLISFGRSLIAGIIRFVKEAILKPLSKLAEGTRGYDLLKAVLGQDPITGEAVPRTAETLIGGFMKLIGQEEVWNNLRRANAVARAWAWFQGVLGGLLGFVRQIPSLFISALRQLELTDIILVPRAFSKVARVFGGFIGQFISWAGQQVLGLLQIIFEVVAPRVMPYLRRAAGAFRSIIENPVRFVGNLVRAGVQGFRQFAGNFLNHLRRSLIEWITGTLSGGGIYIPRGLDLREVIKFVLSVLGLTWQSIRQKLVRLIGEPAVNALETGFELIVTLVREGPAAAWERISQSLSNLREMVMEQIMAFVRDRVVQAAITRLITSLNPAGAFIQAIIATYNTVMFFVERLQQIAQVVMSFIDSIAAIASGNIGSAANRVETTMAGLLTLVISFLARIAGLGRVSDAVKNIVDRVREPIDRALDRVVEWIVNMARRVGRLFAPAGAAPAAATARPPGVTAAPGPAGPGRMAPITVPFQMSGIGHHMTIREAADGVELLIASGTEIPVTPTFRSLYTELDDWRHFLESVRPNMPPAVQRQIDAKIAHLRNIRQTQITRYNAIYARTFGSRRGEEGHRDPNREKEAVRQLTVLATEDLAEIQNWAAGTGMPALSPEAVRSTLRPLAKAAFDQAVALRRQAVDAIVARFSTPNGQPLRYRGSLAKGERGPHKAEVRFNPDDFDLDLFVVDPALHNAILSSNPGLRDEFSSRPIPASRAGGAALTLQRNAVAALEAPGAVPGLRRGANYILVRFAQP